MSVIITYCPPVLPRPGIAIPRTRSFTAACDVAREFAEGQSTSVEDQRSLAEQMADRDSVLPHVWANYDAVGGGQ